MKWQVSNKSLKKNFHITWDDKIFRLARLLEQRVKPET